MEVFLQTSFGEVTINGEKSFALNADTQQRHDTLMLKFGDDIGFQKEIS